MTATSTLREWWNDYECDPSEFVKLDFPGDGRVWSLYVAREAVPAFEAFIDLMEKHKYFFRESSGGTYSCRNINHDPNQPKSLHSYAICIDLNPSKNPFGAPLRYDFPEAFIDDVLALRTNNGKRVFTWGGRWQVPDAMHWQIDCHPNDVATGIAHGGEPTPTPKPPPSGGTYTVNVTRSTIKKGASGSTVKRAQSLLASHGYPPANSFNSKHVPDGGFGSGTDSAVRSFQKAKSLAVDGIIGPNTWGALEKG